MFVLPILIGTLAAAAPPPDQPPPAASAAPPPTVAPATSSTPSLAPAAAPSATPTTPASPATPGSGPVVSDEDDQAGPTSPLAEPPPGSGGQAFPTPYTDLDAKAYSDAVLAAAHEEQALQGPLDGGWSVTDQAGKRLYSLRMVDHGRGMSLAEGAWRDLATPPGPSAAGFVESIGWDGSKLMLRFYESGPDDLVVLTLAPSAADAWSGELWRRGAVVKVSFRRDRT